jgi:hypothetical protein
MVTIVENKVSDVVAPSKVVRMGAKQIVSHMKIVTNNYALHQSETKNENGFLVFHTDRK